MASAKTVRNRKCIGHQQVFTTACFLASNEGRRAEVYLIGRFLFLGSLVFVRNIYLDLSIKRKTIVPFGGRAILLCIDEL